MTPPPPPPTRNRLGFYSLIVAATGFTLLEIGVTLGVLPGPFWQILTYGFEAGTVGALADWFAVSALFHEIPIPFLRRHTNIIAKNRQRITDGVVEMVMTKWLTVEAIREQLQDFSASSKACEYLTVPEQRTKVRAFLLDAIRLLLPVLDRKEFVLFLGKALQDQLKDADMAQPLGRWMIQALRHGDQNPVFNAVGHSVLDAIRAPERRPDVLAALRNILPTALEHYRETSSALKWGYVKLAQLVGGLDYDQAANGMLAAFERELADAVHNPDHPWRQSLNALWGSFSNRLAAGDPDAVRTLQEFQERLGERSDLRELAQKLLSHARLAVADDLARPDSLLRHGLDHVLDVVAAELAVGKPSRARFDNWARHAIQELLARHHYMIEEVIRTSLRQAKMSDRELVGQIEDQTGSDLQFIRLNGSLVGGLAGHILATIKVLLLKGA